MAQLKFLGNNLRTGGTMVVRNASMTFSPFNIQDSISLKTFNFPRNYFSSNSSVGVTLSLGLYSLTGSTLSLANSASGSFSMTSSAAGRQGYMSVSDISAEQNLTPGTWFWGFLFSLSASDNTRFNIFGLSLSLSNAWPGGFVGGSMTASTNALPVSIATTDLGAIVPEVLILLTS